MYINKAITTQVSELYTKALTQWGLRLQVIQLIEEMSELIQALTKFLLDRPNWDNISEEFADVEIMVEQVRLSIAYEDKISNWKTKKLNRLKNILEP